MRKTLFYAVLALLCLAFFGCTQKATNPPKTDESLTQNDSSKPEYEQLPEEKQENKTENEIVLGTEKLQIAVMLQFNTEKEPFDNIDIRRTAAFGIDREALCENIENSLPMYGMIPDGIPDALHENKTYRETVGMIFDSNPQFAKLALSRTDYSLASDYEKGYTLTAKEGDGVAETIIMQLLTNAEFGLQVKYLDAQSYEKALAENDYDVILVDYPCAQDAYEYFSQLDKSPWNNEDFSSALESLTELSNSETYDKLFLYELMENLIFDDVAFAPLFSIPAQNKTEG